MSAATTAGAAGPEVAASAGATVRRRYKLSRGYEADGSRRGRGDWSWGRGLHARPIAGTVATVGLRHSWIERRMGDKEKRRVLFQRIFF